MTPQQLWQKADEARNNAYAPYSQFTVGAALLCEDGSVYSGCNVENASFSPTCCAERVAIFGAIADGKRHFCAIAVAGGKRGEASGPCTPCGVCRQVLAEFCQDGFSVVYRDEAGKLQTSAMAELLPSRFHLTKES
ncbi:MAG: cytidine deaminase [Clostridia bacterium]|nr:cytidine deaminase [Clostridia bacterium]